MSGIGLIDEKRLKDIPRRHWSAHELCFHIHDIMAHLTRVSESTGADRISVKLETEMDVAAIKASANPFEFLEATGRAELHRRMTVNGICRALFPDSLHFIHTGLMALEKRKFSVALASFRKPFKEALPVVAMICADEENFVRSFQSDTSSYFDGRNFNAPLKTKLFSDAFEKMDTLGFGNADHLRSIIFDYRNEFGLASLFDKATHLFTSNQAIKTEDFNVNMIFKDPRDNDIYDQCYSQISYVLVMFHLMQVELLSRIGFPKQDYLKNFMFSTIGSYQAIFQPGRSSMVRLVNEDMADFMRCAVCDETIRLMKKDAPRFFIAERLRCNHCGQENSFPYSWLFSQKARGTNDSQAD